MEKNPLLDFRLKLEIDTKIEGNKDIIIADEYGIENRGLDIDFDIVKSYETRPQTSKIKIYNLSKDTYNHIYKQANAFRLSCARGRLEDYVPFYTGYPIKATQISKQTILTSNEGFMAQDANAGRAGQNDLETEITLMNYGFAQLFKSYQSGVSTELIINDCIEAFGLPKGNMDKWENVTLPTGYTIRGDVTKTLNQLGDRLGFYWNTNDMQFNIYDKNRGQMKTYGLILTPDNSSTPERQNDKFQSQVKTIQKASKKKGIKGVKAINIVKYQQGFKIKTQLVPHLVCGSTIYLKDFGLADASGEKYVYKLRHVGNNTGTECYTEIYCC